MDTSKRRVAIVLMTVLLAVAGACLAQAFIIFQDASEGGASSSSFEYSGVVYPTSGEPLAEPYWPTFVPVDGGATGAPAGNDQPERPSWWPEQRPTWVVHPEKETGDGPARPGPVVDPPIAEGTGTTEPEVETPAPERPDAPVDRPIREVPDNTLPEGFDIGPAPSLTELESLAELEGKQDFTLSSLLTYQGQGQGQGQGSGQTQPGGIADSEGEFNGEADPAEREVEESDIVCLRGEIMYVLNPYRGLVIVDVSDPDDPEVLSTFPVLGTPVEMYVAGSTVYMIVTCDYGYWYSYYSWGRDPENGGRPWYTIGSKLVVVDVGIPSNPRLLLDLPIEGFVSDSRRVGEVIYYVSTCYSWYNRYAGTQMDDMTYVMSVNVMDPMNSFDVDQVCFDGSSYVIHASSERLFISQWEYPTGNPVADGRNGWTNITMVDISDPYGSIVVLDRFGFEGRVLDKYQMDQWGDTFRVVTNTVRPWGSRLLTFDLSSRGGVEPLGNLVIDNNGELMATRFAGERAYTIHLPRRIDPLDVIDLSDPSNPRVCDVFEMPGWVTHMEVRGMRILAIGVDDSGGEWNVAVSLFDVTDPWNVVMEERVRIGDRWASSEANTEPKALTVLDDQGILLVPLVSSGYDDEGNWVHRSGVQIVSFDLEAEDLEVRGFIDQGSRVLRTRGLGDHVISTGVDHLVVADISDLDEPVVTAVRELAPELIDFKVLDGRRAELVRPSNYYYYYYYNDNPLHLRVFTTGCNDVDEPLWEADLTGYPSGWVWDGRNLHVLDDERITVGEGSSRQRLRRITVTTYDLMGDSPEPRSVRVIDAGDYYTSRTTYTTWSRIYSWYYNYYYNYYYDYDYYNYYSSSYDRFAGYDNPVMMEGGLLVLYTQGKLWFVGVGSFRAFTPVESLDVECDSFLGLMPAGSSVYMMTYVGHKETVYKSYKGGYSHYFSTCTVRRVTWHGFSGPCIGEAFSIPGLPLGCSRDASRFYTVSSWYMEDTEDWLYTFNVVTVQQDVATVAWAIDLEDRRVWVDGDTALVYDYDREGAPGTDGSAPPASMCYVYLVDLETCQVGWSWATEDGVYPRYFGNDVAVFGMGYLDGMVLFDLRDIDHVREHRVELRSTMYAVERDGDTLYVAQGKFGLARVDLGS